MSYEPIRGVRNRGSFFSKTGGLSFVFPFSFSLFLDSAIFGNNPMIGVRESRIRKESVRHVKWFSLFQRGIYLHSTSYSLCP